jgi:hypothetical protein
MGNGLSGMMPDELTAKLSISSLDPFFQTVHVLDIIIGDFIMGAVIATPCPFGMEVKVQTAWGEEVIGLLDFYDVRTLRDPKRYSLKIVRDLLKKVGIKWEGDLNEAEQ